ncbi:Hypothetical predicted protein [Podarcis lilfordi]|uniref:Uncharacterized protein n=1 Tax=Podarcis lilfordi TaxID=74358 RepID=A0AA35L7F8_9SAUR|nr:Hypothetical predicted protein [Podarcis lilfordi]
MTAAIFNAKYKFFERIKIQQWRVSHIIFLPSMPTCELAMMVVKVCGSFDSYGTVFNLQLQGRQSLLAIFKDSMVHHPSQICQVNICCLRQLSIRKGSCCVTRAIIIK